MRRRWRVVRHDHFLAIANAPQCHVPFPVLRRLRCIGLVKLARRLWKSTQCFRNLSYCNRLSNLSGNNYNSIVRLVVLAVKGCQLVDGHIFQIRLGPNCRLAIVVPQESSCFHPFLQNTARTIFATFEFVAHNCHFGVQNCFLHFGIHHPVRFQRKRPAEVLGGCGESLKVVGAIRRCAAIPTGAMACDFLLNVTPIGSLHEQQMLQ